MKNALSHAIGAQRYVPAGVLSAATTTDGGSIVISISEAANYQGNGLLTVKKNGSTWATQPTDATDLLNDGSAVLTFVFGDETPLAYGDVITLNITNNIPGDPGGCFLAFATGLAPVPPVTNLPVRNAVPIPAPTFTTDCVTPDGSSYLLFWNFAGLSSGADPVFYVEAYYASAWHAILNTEETNILAAIGGLYPIRIRVFDPLENRYGLYATIPGAAAPNAAGGEEEITFAPSGAIAEPGGPTIASYTTQISPAGQAIWTTATTPAAKSEGDYDVRSKATSSTGAVSAWYEEDGIEVAAAAGLNLVAGWNFKLFADDLVGADGSNVASWDGDGVVVTPPATAPTLQTNEINGHNAVAFATSRMHGTLDVPLASPSTWFYVLAPTDPSVDQFVVDGEYPAPSGRNLIYLTAYGIKAYQSGFTTGSGPVLSTAPLLLTEIFDGTSTKTRINGAEFDSSNSGTNGTLTDLMLGCDGAGSALPFTGRLALVAAYATNIGGTDIAANEAAIAAYYGIELSVAFTIADVNVGGGQFIRIVRPASLPESSDGTAAPMCYYFHGSGEDEKSITTDPQKRSILNRLLTSGYRVVASNSTTPGDAIGIHNTLVLAGVNISRVVFLAQSNGGETSLPCCADADWSGIVKGWYGIYPNCQAGLAITTADFLAIKYRAIASYGDTTIDRAANSDALLTKLTGQASSITVTSHTGNHGDPSAFQAADVGDFFDSCT